jgi:hypothetical protein
MKLFTKDIDKKLFAQFEQGSDLENQMVVAKIFNPYGRGVWYIVNSDPSDPDYLWAIVDLFEVEAGSVSRSELETIKVPPFRLPLERDMYFTPINAAELYRGLLAGKRYAEGGEISIEAQNKDMLLNYAKEFEEAAKKAEKVMPWVIAKIERSSTDLSDVTHYLSSENEKRREYGNGEGEEEYADGGEIKWQDAQLGDSALVVSENKMGVIMKPYGRKFHLKFADGTEKTYDASELKFFGDIDDFDRGGMMAEGGEVKGFDAMSFREVTTRDGSKVEVMRDRKFYRGSLKDVISEVYEDFYPTDVYANIKERSREGFIAKVKSDGTAKIMADGYGFTKGEEVKVEKKVEEEKEEKSPKKKLFGIFEDGGETRSMSDIYKDLENKRTTIRLKIASVIGIDKALESLNQDFVISPFKLIESAVNKGFITIDEIDEKMWDAATEEAYDVDSTYRDSGEGIGSSDINAFINSMLKSAGINMQVVENRYQRMAEGGEVEEGVDLFEDYDNIPSNVQKVLDKYSDAFEDGDYKELEKANKELGKIGYTFEYGLDGQAYDLRKVGEKGKSEYMAKGGEISVKVGDKVKSKSGIEGEVYESTGMFFKLQDKYGNKGQKFYSTRDFKPSEIKSMAQGGEFGVDKHKIYFSSFAEVMEAINDIADENGYKIVEIFPDLSYGGVSYGQTKRAKVELEWNGKEKVGKSKKREKNTLNVQIYRMDSGNYELNSYFSYAEGGKMEKGGKIYKIQVKDSDDLQPKWQDDTFYTGGKKYLSYGEAQKAVKKLQGDTAYYSKQFKVIEDKEKMAMGGKVKFADKVKSIKKSLLERKKVSPKVQKDYGKTYSPKEAEESAKRIVGAMTAKERLMEKRKKSKK